MNIERIYKPRKSSYAILTSLLIVPVGISLTIAVDSLNVEAFIATGAGFLGMCFLWLYLLKMRIYIKNDKVIFQSLFQGTKELPLKEVTKAKICSFDYQYGNSRLAPPIQLHVFTSRNKSNAYMSINAKVFGRDDLKEIIKILND